MNLTSGETTVTSIIAITYPSIILRHRCPNIRTTLVCPGHVYTPMFRTVVLPTSPFFAFFCPSVQPVTVIKKIITALDDQHSQVILLPFYTNFIPYIGHLPSFLRDLVQWVSRVVLLGWRDIEPPRFSDLGRRQSHGEIRQNIWPSSRRRTNPPCRWYKNELKVSQCHMFLSFRLNLLILFVTFMTIIYMCRKVFPFTL